MHKPFLKTGRLGREDHCSEHCCWMLACKLLDGFRRVLVVRADKIFSRFCCSCCRFIVSCCCCRSCCCCWLTAADKSVAADTVSVALSTGFKLPCEANLLNWSRIICWCETTAAVGGLLIILSAASFVELAERQLVAVTIRAVSVLDVKLPSPVVPLLNNWWSDGGVDASIGQKGSVLSHERNLFMPIVFRRL